MVVFCNSLTPFTGMKVDSISEVKYLSSQDIEEMPGILALRNDYRFLKGAGKIEDGIRLNGSQGVLKRGRAAGDELIIEKVLP
ncbi:hypothetical protein ACSAZL_04625 [Methanosarcina sp. T3]|uniref:hypothetical protein n=1 Tax=Methanosarcina sp. T3 TaxID=3439062 RepID=UPI003F84B270